MRVRIIKDFSILNEVFRAGEVREIDMQTGKVWLRTGLAMEEKSLDGARETKTSGRENI